MSKIEKEILLTGTKWKVKAKKLKTKNRRNNENYLEISSENGVVSEYINPSYFMLFVLRNKLAISKTGVINANINFVGYFDEELGHLGWTYKFELIKDKK